VGARHEETVETPPLQLAAQRGDPCGNGATIARLVKCLEQRFEHRGTIGAAICSGKLVAGSMHWRIHIMHAPWKPIPCLMSLCCILASLLAGGEGGWKSGLQEWILQSGLAVGRERIMIDRVADRSLADHSFADRFLHPKVEDGLQIGAADAGSEKDE